jgi:RHS repeat-associated protein
MIAAKMLDMVMGIDIHIIQPPGPVPPLPIPHPFIGMVLDPIEYAPFIGASTWVNGQPRAQAGNEAKNIPPHIPLGGTFIKPVDNEGEIFMGSSTVVVDGEPFSRLGSPVLSCSCIGMPSPPRPKGKAKSGMKLPTSVLIAIPGGGLVLVGGPPTISLMAIGMKLGMFAGGKFFNKFVKNSGAYKALCKKAHDAASVVTRHLPGNMAKKAHKKLCDAIGHPVDVATGKVFTDLIDFEIPGPWPISWERSWDSVSTHDGQLGHGWHHVYDMALGISDNGSLELRTADGRNVFVPYLYTGEEAYLKQEKLRFTRDDEHFIVTDEEYTSYLFKAAEVDKYGSSNLHCILRPGAQKISFSYEKNQLREIEDSTGRRLRVSTDQKGRITAIEAPHPNAGHAGKFVALVRYRYDHLGDLVESIDALGNSFHYEYEDHLLVRETNRNGLNFFFTYDREQFDWPRCVRTWGDEGIHENTLVYDLEAKTTQVVNSRGKATIYSWNDDGLVWKTINPQGNEEIRQYGDACNLVREIDEIQRATTYEYDALGHRSLVKYPDGTKVMMSRKEHLLVAAADQIGGSWSWKYDEFYRLIARTAADGSKTEYAYDGPNLTDIVDNAGHVTRLGYDQRHNLVELTTPDEAKSTWQYDELGRVIAALDPRGNRQERKLNLLGNVLKVREPDGNVRVLEYDGEENIVRAKDQQHDVRFRYVGMNRLGEREEAGTQVQFKYDTEENLTGIVNEHGFAYRFGLDVLGNVVSESGFDGLTRTYERDAAGQVVRVARPGDRATGYDYDPVGRVTAVKHWDGSKENYAYRADGELLAAVNGAVAVRFERDKLGRVLTEYQGGFAVNSIYDKLGNRIGLTSSLGADVSIQRNLMGDVEEVVSGAREADPWSVHFERDLLGLELERSMPGGVKSQWKRDRLGRPTKQTTSVGGRKENSRTYQWGVNDRLKAIIDDNKGRFEYEHDVFGNLAAATYPDGSKELRMPDAVGNLFKTKGQGDRKYGPAGQLLEADGTTFRYDAEGNLIGKTKKDGGRWAYEWNAAGMLARVTRPDGKVVSFTYDALGRRIAKKFGRRLTRWVWDGNVMLHEWREDAPPTPLRATPKAVEPQEETRKRIVIRRRAETVSGGLAAGPPTSGNGTGGTGAGNATSPAGASDNAASVAAAGAVGLPSDAKTTVPLPGEEGFELLTAVSGDLTTWLFEPESFSPLAKLTPARDYGIVTDHLGTPQSMYSADGEKSWELELSVYGDVRKLDGWRGECPFRYPGQYEDEETGLYYNRFRYYCAEVGGYVSQDPIGLAGSNPNLYGYVKDPLLWIDIFGLECWNTSRKKFWKAEAVSNPGKYSPGNLKRMKDGKAPKMTVTVRNRKTGNVVTKDVSIELHHTNIPQRVGGAGVHDASNLTIVDPWQHEKMDPFRHTGNDLISVDKGVDSW